MIRLATYCIGITLILASCNLLSPEAETLSSTHLASDLISATSETVQTGNSDAQSDVLGEHPNTTAIPGRCNPENNILMHTTESLPAEQIGVRIAGHISLNDGSGLANVSICLSLAAYSGERIALTDEKGDFLSSLKYIPGDENVTVWAELDGYTFQPSDYHWRHYHGLEERTLNFSAAASTPTSSAQSNSVSNDLLPAWVGTPAIGDSPRSEHPLPEGINNGDIVLGQDNLFWFIWENTKSRVWFPGLLSENDLSSLPDGSDMDRRLMGSSQPDSVSGYLAITDKGNIFWIDPIRGNQYPINLITVSRDDLDSIPTANGE